MASRSINVVINVNVKEFSPSYSSSISPSCIQVKSCIRSIVTEYLHRVTEDSAEKNIDQIHALIILELDKGDFLKNHTK